MNSPCPDPALIRGFGSILDLLLCFLLCPLLSGCESSSEPTPLAEQAVVEIVSPTVGGSVYFSDTLNFELSLSVPEESVARISWVSSLDGPIGEGLRFYRSDLKVGQHDVTVSILFIDDSVLTRDLGLTILPRNQNALLSVHLPDPDSLWYFDTDSRDFEVAARDGSLRILPLRSAFWTSNRDGIVSQTTSLPVSDLSLGEHDLSVAVAFEDGSAAGVVLAGVEIVRDPYGETDLLNDREMWTRADPDAPFVRKEWQDWVRAASHPLRSLHSDDYSDLAFLDDLVKGKSIVQMGEVAHGIAEQNRIRVRLIKYLHEKHGFDVVAFESGFFECLRTEEALDTLEAKTALFNSLWSFWHTKDLLDLFSYLKGTRATEVPLHVAGFDVNQTGRVVGERPGVFRDLAALVDSTFSEAIFQADQALLSLSGDRQTTFIHENFDTLLAVYDRLVELIESRSDVLVEEFTEREVKAFHQAALSARDYLEFRNEGNDQVRVYIRDARMAESFRFIREVLYPGHKVIVWAHNAHVMKDPQAVQSVPYPKMMGSWLDEWYGDGLMTVVSLGYRGTIDYGSVHNVEITDPEAIEAIFYHTRMRSAFLDLAHQSRDEANGWMFEPTSQTYLHSRVGAYSFTYIPSEQFDGVIFIDTLSKASIIGGSSPVP